MLCPAFRDYHLSSLYISSINRYTKRLCGVTLPLRIPTQVKDLALPLTSTVNLLVSTAVQAVEQQGHLCIMFWSA